MKKKTVLLSIFLVFILISSPHVSVAQVRRSRGGMRPSQMRDAQRRNEQHQLERQQQSQEFTKIREAYRDEAAQDALGVDAEQWQLIKLKMERIRELHRQPTLAFFAYGFASGESSNSTSSSQSGSIPSSGRIGTTRGWGGGRAGGSAGGMAGSVRSGSGGSAGATGGGSYGSSSGSSSGSSYGYGFGGGAGPNGDRPVKKQVGELKLGWMWPRPSENKKLDELTESDKMCEQLLDAITAETPDHDLVQQRVEQFRQLRQERLRQLRQIQQELRELVSPEQEAKLILMGYLD